MTDERALIEETRELHFESTEPAWGAWCRHCQGVYPCLTTRLAEALERSEQHRIDAEDAAIGGQELIDLLREERDKAVQRAEQAEREKGRQKRVLAIYKAANRDREKALDLAAEGMNNAINRQREAEAERDEARRDLAAAERGLKSLERVTDEGDDWEYCVVCGKYLDARYPNAGHTEDCRLVLLLATISAGGGTTDD